MNKLIALIGVLLLTILAAGKSFVPVPVQAQTEPATAAVQKVLDDYAARLKAIEDAAPKPSATTRRTSELGCKPNDPAFDNAPLLQAAIDAGFAIEVDGFYHTSPLRTKAGQANAIRGVSAAAHKSPPCRTGFAAFAAGQPHILEITGDTTLGAGYGQVVSDLHFAGVAGCDAVVVKGGDAVAIERCSFRGCRDAIEIAPAIRVYSVAVRSCFMHTCDTGLRVGNATNVCCLTVDGLSINGGRVGVMVDGWKRGAVFTGVLSEGQTQSSFEFRDARGTLIGCYGENGGDIPTLAMQQSKVTLIDCRFHKYRQDGNSQITLVGDNNLGGTIP